MELTIICYYFISICASFVVKGLVGFGDPLLSGPLLSVHLPNSVITPGLAPLSPILNAGVIWKNRSHFSKEIVLPISFFNLLGVIPGTFVLKYASPKGLKLLLGLVIIGIGVEMLTRKTAPVKPSAAVRNLISFCSGITAGLFGMNLLFLAYMERVAINREEFRANACFVFFIENLFRLVLYGSTNMFSKESLILFLISLPAGVLGMKIGSIIDKRVNDRLSHQFIIYVFILGGVSTTIYALLQVFK